METTVEELRALGPNGATVINVGHHQGKAEIRGAIRYRPHDLLTPSHLALPIAPELPVVLYDEHGKSDETQQIAQRFEQDGFKDVRILQGGYAAWEAVGGETQEPTIEQVVPPSKPSEVQELDRRV
jgi:3-mercaptopyruvate sulfurtransferase SseA